jgi:hypothetical protein
MKLFEVAGNQFQDDLANVLKVMQGQADSKQTTSLVTWADINNRLQGYGEITQDIMAKIKDKIDKDGALIQDIVPEGIVLKTKVENPEQAEPMAVPTGGKSVAAMATSAAQDSLK